MKLWIVRHGETDWNTVGRLQGSRDIPLNMSGIQQALESADYLAESDWDVLISSPLKRAYETAEVIQGKIRLPITIMKEFKEMHFGDAEGLLKDERKHILNENNQFPNQEELSVFKNRIVAGLDVMIKKYEGKNIILVAHGRVLNELLEILSDGKLVSGKLGLVNGCINKLTYNGEWLIDEYNVTAHLTTFSETGKI